MTRYHNIEKLPGKTSYTGYADGAWTITKSFDNAGHRTWTAVHQNAKYIRFSRSTLGAVSEMLDRINGAYSEGSDAFKNGHGLQDNPMTPGSRQFDAWKDGFEGAKKIMDESD